MPPYVFVFVSFFIAVNAQKAAKGFEVESLEKLNGLQFERIGSLKLIVERRTLKFDMNFTALVEHDLQQITSEIEKVCNESKEKCNSDVEKLLKIVETNANELNDMLSKNVRRKRWILTAGDGVVIAKDLKDLNQNVYRHHQYLRFLENFTKRFMVETNSSFSILTEATLQQTNSTTNLKVSLLIQDLFFKMLDLEAKVRSINKVMAVRRMDIGIN